MYVITYSLQADKIDSDEFYNATAAYTDEVIIKAKKLMGPVINNCLDFTSNRYQGYSCTFEEAVLEVLLLGTFWRIYGGDAMGIDSAPRNILAMLAEMRRQNDNLKPGIDFLRGIMSTIFLSPDLYDNLQLIAPGMNNFKRLVLWLQSTGEFVQETKRLEKWQEYLAALTDKEATDIIATAITLSFWFENSSAEKLGIYTENVDRYLNETRPAKYWHEDVVFCGRRRTEYHLNMVGAEIMNRAFKKAFLETDGKLLLLPACMRLLPGSKCKAVASGKSAGCVGCSSECQINQLSQIGKKLKFDVAVVSHESSISSNMEKGLIFNENTGVIGVACVLNLISGGWMLKEAGIPAQCVLLDYCGCKNHWHSEGIPTKINIGRLEKILSLT